MEADVPEDLQDEPVLTMEQIRELVRLGLKIEEIFGTPQDMEWAVDRQGRIWILQTRPLILHQEQQGGEGLEQGPANILLRGGLITSRGKATGRVVIIRSRKDLERLPEGPVIMVMHQSLVDAAKLLEKASGVLVDLGNPADHLSCVAREYGRPMITGLARATELLEPGQWITVDANRALVYEATEEEIAQQRKKEGLSGAKAGQKEPGQKEADREQEGPQDPRIKRLRELTVKLNLTDAYGPTFSIMECRSLHDIVRYVHEKAVLAIFEAGDELLEGTSGVVLKLKSDIPFFLNIIDIGGGLPRELKGRRWVRPEEIV
jgi:pyruvate,water dikinase